MRRKNLDDAVKFLGLVRGVEKTSLYEAADLLVIPTSQENFGLVFPEAMACRTPVVTTKGVDIWQEIESAGATIVEPTPAAVASAIDNLLSDPVNLRDIGDRGRRWVFDTLGPDQLLAQYESLYANLT